MEKKTISILVFAKHLDGGTGAFITQLLKLGKIQKGLKIQVIALETPLFRLLPANATVKFFSDKQLLPYSYILTPVAIRNTIKELIWLKEQIVSFRPEIVITIDNHCGVLICLFKLFAPFSRLRIIFSIHNNISAVTFAKLPAWGRRVFRYVSRQLFRKADAIVCVSKGVAVDAKKFFSLTSLPYVIHIGVNIQNIQRFALKPIKPEHEDIFRSKKTKIITIGRFAPQKDFETLFHAFATFYKKNGNTELIIIGDGPEKEQLVSMVRKLKLSHAVHFLGWQQNVYPYIHASDIFMLSSNYEGFPYVLLEAGALGKPIVATDSPYGPRELLGDNTYGLVVPMKSSKALAKALGLLMNKNTYVHYQSQIMNRVKKFSENIMLRRYQALIETLA